MPRDRSTSSRRLWIDLACVAVVALGAFASRATTLPLRGEETRRGQIAVEMMRRGGWVVPRQQGEPFLSRPPLQNWLIALAGLARGGVDKLAIRLPSIIAACLTTLLLFLYGRACLSPLAGLLAAVVFATMIHVQRLAPLGETEAVYMLILTGAFLLWHMGVQRGWRPWRIWTVGYALAAAATLTKGAQGPIYFIGGAWCYLVVTRRWPLLLCRGHCLGLVAFTSLLALWYVPFVQRVGWDALWRIHFGDALLHSGNRPVTAMLLHMLVFPLAVLGATLPWSVFLGLYALRSVRRALRPMRDATVFLACSVVVAFLPAWLAAGAVPRHYMVMYPLIAVLIAIVLARLVADDAPPVAHAVWRRFLRVFAVGGVLVPLAVLALTIAVPDSDYRQPIAFCIVALVVAPVPAVWLWRSPRRPGPAPIAAAAIMVAWFVTLGMRGLYVNFLSNRSIEPRHAVKDLRRSLPPDARIASIRPVHHRFSFHYGEPIGLCASLDAVPDAIQFVCFDTDKVAAPAADDPGWEVVATIVIDRFHFDPPRQTVKVIRRRSRGR